MASLPYAALFRLGSLRLRHFSDATAVAFSPDYRYLASAGMDNSIKIWETENYRLKMEFLGHEEIPWSLKFHPTKPWLFSGGDDGLKIWDLEDEGEIALWEDWWTVTRMVVSTKGRYIVTVGQGENNALYLIDLEEYEFEKVLPLSSDFNGLAFSPVESLFAVGNGEELILYHARENKIQEKIQTDFESIEAISFSQFGDLIAIGGYPYRYKILDCQKWKEIPVPEVEEMFRMEDSSIDAMAFSPIEKKLGFNGGFSNNAYILQLEEKKILDIQASPKKNPCVIMVKSECGTRKINALDFSPDGKRIATASSNGRIQLWNSKTGREEEKLIGHNWGVQCASVFDEIIVTGGDDERLLIWNASDGSFVRELHKFEYEVQSTGFSNCGNFFAATEGRTVHIWETKTWKRIQIIKEHLWPQSLEYIIFDSTGKYIFACGIDATGGDKNQIHAWEISKGSRTLTIEEKNQKYNCISFDKTGNLWAGSQAGNLYIYESKTGCILQKLQLEEEYSIHSMQFSHDQKQLICGGRNKLSLWDAKSQKRLKTFDMPISDLADGVKTIAFWAETPYVFVGGKQTGELLIINTETEKILSLKGHCACINQIVVENGKGICVTVSEDSTALLWNLADFSKIV